MLCGRSQSSPKRAPSVAAPGPRVAPHLGRVAGEQHRQGAWQERQQALADAHRPRSRSPAAVRGRERLVQVEVHDVEARLARSEAAHDRVEVGAVHVGDGARLLDRRDHLVDLVLEDAERRRVGDHQRRHVRAERRAQRLQVDPATLVGGNGDRRVADHGGGRRVRAVRAVRHQHLGALLALAGGPMVGACHEQPGQLAVGPGRRLEADRGEAADLAQQLGEQPLQLQAALRQRLRDRADASRLKPVSRAAHSLTLGLYFMVHEPSG